MGYRDTILADSPYLYWRLSELVGATVASDETANNRDGEYSGGTLEQPGANTGDTACYMDGVDDKALLSSGVGLGASFSLEAWIKPDASADQLTTAPTFIDQSNHTNKAGFRFQTRQDELRLLLYDGVGAATVGGPFTMGDGLWHHAVATYDGTTVRVYLDGAEIASGALSYTETATTEAFHVGRAGGQEWAGVVDEAAIYAAVLTAAQVQAHYDARETVATEVQRMAPDAILAVTGLTGTVGDIQDDPDAPDTLWMVV